MLTIRPLRPWDSAFCWRLANEPSVRAASHNSTPPSLFGHLRWMARWLFGRDRQAWVVVSLAACCLYHNARCALVRVEQRGAFRAVLSIAVLPEFRGQGIAQTAIRHASEYAIDNGWGTPTAYIRRGNTASQLAFRGAGFTMLDALTDSGAELVVMEYREPRGMAA